MVWCVLHPRRGLGHAESHADGRSSRLSIQKGDDRPSARTRELARGMKFVEWVVHLSTLAELCPSPLRGLRQTKSSF